MPIMVRWDPGQGEEMEQLDVARLEPAILSAVPADDERGASRCLAGGVGRNGTCSGGEAGAGATTEPLEGASRVMQARAAGGVRAIVATSSATRESNCNPARRCCTQSAVPATLAEAMDEVCKYSVNGDLQGVKTALQLARTFDDFAMNVPGTHGRTPLFQACLGQQPKVVQWLLDQADYVADRDGNLDAYGAISATATRHDGKSNDPGVRTAYIMQKAGYDGSGRISTTSPAAPPMQNAEPEPEPELTSTPSKCKDSWRICCIGDSTKNAVQYEYTALLDKSDSQEDARPSPKRYGNLSRASRQLIGDNKSFREGAIKVKGQQTPSSTQKIIDHLNDRSQGEKHLLQTAAGPTVSVDVDGRTFELTVNMCQFEDSVELKASVKPIDYRGVIDDEETIDDSDSNGNDTILVYEVTDVAEVTKDQKVTKVDQQKYHLEVGRKHEAIRFCDPTKSGACSHRFLYKQCNTDANSKFISNEGRSVTLTLDEESNITFSAKSVNDAEAICYFVQLGHSAWNISDSDRIEQRSGGTLHQLGSTALQALDVDETMVTGCRRSCSAKKCSRVPTWLGTSFKGCWQDLCAFFKHDVNPDHSTPTCVWLWIFVLQLVCHLLFPPLVLWSRTRKADGMPQDLVRQRCLVLSVRWAVIVGSLAVYARGDLPSMASSELAVTLLLWVFVAVTHSAREASLDEIPQQFNDTLSAAFKHQSRHVNSSEHDDGIKGRLIEHELGYFLRYGRNKQSKFSHRMTERRLHELHQERLQIDNARFESFHSTELQSELSRGKYILSLGSTSVNQTRIFDEVITTLQTIFHETPDWCLSTSLGDELFAEDVVPDSVRKAAAMVRMHVKEVQRKRYSTMPGDTAAYAFEIDRLAAEAVKWEREGGSSSSSSSSEEHGTVEEKGWRALRGQKWKCRCVLSRDHALRSNTDDKLHQWDVLAKRVTDALSHDVQDETWAQRCYAFLLLLVSVALVIMWIWLGTWLEEYVSHYLMLECADISCACWCILSVGAAICLVAFLVFYLHSVLRRFETFRTTTLSDKLVTEVTKFVADWEDWEAQGSSRTLSSQSIRQSEVFATDADAGELDDNNGLCGVLFGNDTDSQPPTSDQGKSLEELTALSADKLQVGSFDEFNSKTNMWSGLSTSDFDRFSLELSRVERGKRQQMLTKWKELRVNEMLAPHREMAARSGCWCCSQRASHQKVAPDADTLNRTDTELEKEHKLGGDGGLWERMVRGRVERERRIIELRAELLSRLERALKETHGVVDVSDAENPATPPATSRSLQANMSQNAFGVSAYEKEKLQAYLVAESILALAHTQSKKLYAWHLYCITIVCVLDALCHPLKVLISSWLGMPCEEDVTHHCVLNKTHDSSWSSPGVDSVDLCVGVNYNDTFELSCGEGCDVESTVYFSCTPLVYEVMIRTANSVIGALLVFSVFSDLAEVIRGYQLRYDAIQYFSQLTPNQGSLTHQRKNHFGLLPTFELNTKRNIIVWNRIRVFLQTYDQHNFSVSQHKITWILLIPVVFVIYKAIEYINGDVVDSFIAAEDLGEWSKFLFHVDTTPELVDTLILKAILLQFMGAFLICHMFYIGVCTTRLHEHDIPHILLLKKAEIAAGQIVPTIACTEPLPSLFYSNKKQIKLWCNYEDTCKDSADGSVLTQAESNGFTSEKRKLSAFVKRRIEDIRKHVEDIMGIPTADFGGLGISVRDHRPGHKEDGGHLPASATKIAKSTLTRDRASPRDSYHISDDWDGWLQLAVTIHDGHDIYVDVDHLKKSDLNDEQREMLNNSATARGGVVIIGEVDDITDVQESQTYASFERMHSHENSEMNCQYRATMELTQLLDSLISVMSEERRELIHAPTIEDTRPALNLPSCCMKYRIGLTRKLFGTILTVMSTSLFALIQSLLEDY